MLDTICIACQGGFHDSHTKMIEIPLPGVMGGKRCVCRGECTDGRYEAERDKRTREMIEGLHQRKIDTQP